MSNLNEDLTTGTNVNNEHVSPEQVPGAHDSDGTLGRTAGTGTGAIAGGMLGSVVGPVGTVVGAIAGGMLGHAAGNAAHDIGDDHDDVSVRTGSDGHLGRDAGTGAGAISGAVIGSAAGPVGTVAGAVAGGMLGAAAGDATKDFGGHRGVAESTDNTYATTTGVPPINAVDYDTTSTTANFGTANVGTVNDADHIRVPVMEEQLNVQKAMQQSGEVAVHKHVIEEQVNIPVEISREQVTIERHATDRPLAAGETLLNDGDVIRVPVMEETVNVTKSAHVVEEIEIGKTRTTEQQNVSDTIRKERVEVDDPTQTIRDNRTI